MIVKAQADVRLVAFLHAASSVRPSMLRHTRDTTRALQFTSSDDAVLLTRHPSIAATRWRKATRYRHKGEGVRSRSIASRRSACDAARRLSSKLGRALAPLFGFGWIWPHAMHAMAGQHFCVESVRELDGRRRKAKIGRTGIVLSRDCDVSIRELVVALPNEALSLCARRRIGCPAWH
jgi:hypothetical protein